MESIYMVFLVSLGSNFDYFIYKKKYSKNLIYVFFDVLIYYIVIFWS